MSDATADWTLGGDVVTRGRLTAPLSGRWVADLEVDTAEALTGHVELRIGGVAWIGTVFRGGVDDGADVWRGRVVGGAGGLDRPVDARSWQGLQPARGLVTELLSEVGEALSEASGAEVDTHLARWCRVTGPAHRALADLVRAVGARWRMTPEGTVWVGTETWPDLVVPEDSLSELLSQDAREGTAVYALSGSYLLPGQTFDGRHVGGVVYALDDEGDRVTVWWADG